MLGGALSLAWGGDALGSPLPEGLGEPWLVLGSPERFLLRAGKRAETSARQPTELLRSSGGAAEASGLASVHGDSKWRLQDCATCWPWGGRGVQGLCVAPWGSQSGGLPGPLPVLSPSWG